ncbi:MAG: amidohydrolase family protein, partial [Candidatus Acidiferrales bacterium]
MAPVDKERVKEVRQFSDEGGDTFAFTPDASALVYAAGNRVWRHPLTGGEREEIPIRLELKRPTPPPLLLRRVRVLDFKAGGFGPETAVFIEQGRIRWIGSERGRKIPRETVILDAGGRFAIPGLFDLHVHQDPRRPSQEVLPEAFIAYGVTTVRDTGAWLTWMNTLVDRGEASNKALPRYFFSGEILEGALPARYSIRLLIHNEDEARDYVRRLKEGGAHFIKVYYTTSGPLQRAVADEARQQGLPVIGHGERVKEITQSVTLGYRMLEHGPWGRFYGDVIKMLAAAGTRWDPTLADWGGDSLLLRDEPERLADAKLRAFASEADIAEAQTGDRNWKAVGDKALRGHWAEVLAGIRAAHHLGVKLQAGTDAGPDPPSFFGSSLHWELEFFVQAGIPLLEVLRIATQQAAEAVGAEDDLGTLEPGK